MTGQHKASITDYRIDDRMRIIPAVTSPAVTSPAVTCPAVTYPAVTSSVVRNLL